MEDQLPKFDIPGDFITGDFITKEILDFYKAYPCKIKSAIFVIISDGQIDATVNLTRYTLKRDDFVIIFPNTFIQIHEIEGNIKLHFVAFSSTFLDEANIISHSLDFLPLLIDNPIISLPEETALICRDFMDLLIRSYFSSDNLLDKENYRSILMFMLKQTSKHHQNNTHLQNEGISRDRVILKEFMQLLLLNYTREHSVTFYAKALGITLQHFCNTIKKVTHKTALEIISGMIITDAKAQLKSTNLAIKEISLTLGFTNQAFFNKFFKQHTGLTPQEYRKSE